MFYDKKAKIGLTVVVSSFVGLLAYDYFVIHRAGTGRDDRIVTVIADVKSDPMRENRSGHCRYLNTVDDKAERKKTTVDLSELMYVETEAPKHRSDELAGCGVAVEFIYNKQRYRWPQQLPVSGGQAIRDVRVRETKSGQIFVKLPGRGEEPAVYLGPAG